jgi:hypothetical protein
MKQKYLLFATALLTLQLFAATQPTGPGFPTFDPKLDERAGFVKPPTGYNEVPFWWWTGDDLNVDRLVWQVEELHKMGISGVQVNYSHYDSSGWPTEQGNPKIFTPEWWKVYGEVSKACAKHDMGIGLSTYTLDWPRGGQNLFLELFYKQEKWNARGIKGSALATVKGATAFKRDADPKWKCVVAYAKENGVLSSKGFIKLPLTDGKIDWTAPADKEFAVWAFWDEVSKGTFNPMMPNAGDIIVKSFFQPFEDNSPSKSSKGLNYFFNDELHIGLNQNAWCDDFPVEFKTRKGYDLFSILPVICGANMVDIVPKARIDYADVRMSLMEERYFKPIFDWHHSRGMIYACDPGSRGTNPGEFGDYFRANRWYTAPGHDTPGGSANLIKNKVSSSIANLYQRPRVWLEGYHSLGWGATPEVIMKATRENFLYGANLLNLHGLYYTTYGSHWEWAPPCYHFRMPYWAHMKSFFDYFERLSYIASQGHLVADVAIIYPVAGYEAGLAANEATSSAFDIGSKLFAAGINFEYVDHQSLECAVVKDGRLVIAGPEASYKTLIFPNMKAVRWSSMEKAEAFAKAGGLVYVVGALPEVSDRAGANDPLLTQTNDKVFTLDRRMQKPADLCNSLRKAYVQDVVGIDCKPRAMHRKTGLRDMYMVMDTQPGDVVEFRTKSSVVELWDPGSGESTPLEVMKVTETGTQVRLTREPFETSVVMFGGQATAKQPQAIAASRQPPSVFKELTNAWTVAFEPTMNNTFGDFRMPVTKLNKMIGVEARRLDWKAGTLTDKQLYGYGTQFYVLGPLPAGTALTPQEIDVAKPVEKDGKRYTWKPYDFSWRMGKEDNLGHQGYHGLKRIVTDDFICLGKNAGGLNETKLGDEMQNGIYYLWSTLTVAKPTTATILCGDKPSPEESHTSSILKLGDVWVNGEKKNVKEPLTLKAGSNPLLICYTSAGRGHFVVRDAAIPQPTTRDALSTRWANDKGIIPFDIFAGTLPEETFTFVTAPGTKAIELPELDATVSAFINDKPMKKQGNRFIASQAEKGATIVKLLVTSKRPGLTGGGLFSEPIRIGTDGTGLMSLGDWSKAGILNNYSGGVRYKTRITLTAEEAKQRLVLDLGRVAGTAEVFVNGKSCGICLCSPWKKNLTGLRAGDNDVDVLVYNSLSNHYQTIPSHYRGSCESGLLGPVKVLQL